VNLTRDYDRAVEDARHALDAAESMAERARFLASVIERAGLVLPQPERGMRWHGEEVRFRWPLMATRRGCGNGCGNVAATLLADNSVVWEWVASEILVQHYPGTDRPLVRYTPDYVENVPYAKVTSPEPPQAFIEFVQKHIDLMYSCHEQ
jgi:hypothetical protein